MRNLGRKKNKSPPLEWSISATWLEHTLTIPPLLNLNVHCVRNMQSLNKNSHVKQE